MATSSGGAGILRVIIDNSLLLILGTVAALVWANIDVEGYNHVAHAVHFAVNDIGMVFFFALAAKEVFEAMLPGGPLASPRQAGVPMLAAVGGMVAPASIYALTVTMLGQPELVRGWAIPCATDIAFSYLVARAAFPKGHPAIPFLLLLAIVDDALGLIVLAIFYPSGPVSAVALFLWLVPACVLAWVMRRGGLKSFWWYLAGPGVMSWIGLHSGGLHPALALVPIVPFMPHKNLETSLFGRFGADATTRSDTMNDFEHWWRIPVQFILLAFGLANAGVPLSSVGTITWIVLASLVIGKPVGIFATTLLAEKIGFRRAPGLTHGSVALLGVMAGIGFTVALFFATAAFPPGLVLDEAKMGALISFVAAPIALVLAAVMGIKRATGTAAANS